MPRIFISYRRGDAIYQAQMLFERLTSEFGRGSVFMDLSSIPQWVDFEGHIVDAIEASDALVVLMGDRWLTELEARRDGPFVDYVRFEILSALERGIPLIPVLVEQARVPRLDELPAEMAGLLRLTFSEIRGTSDLAAQVDRFVKSLGALPARSKSAASRPPPRLQPALPVKNLALRIAPDGAYHVRIATTIEIGRQSEASFPLGGFEEARHFSDAQRSSWARLSRRQLRLSITTAGLALEDLRDLTIRAERVAYLNGKAWTAADVALLPPHQQSIYEIADVVRWSFHPLRAVEVRGPALAPELDGVVRAAGLGGSEIRVQWPGAEAPSPHVLLVLWSAVAFAPDHTAKEDLFLLARSDNIWLGSVQGAPRLLVDSLAVSAGELVPLAPGRTIVWQTSARCGDESSLTLTCS